MDNGVGEPHVIFQDSWKRLEWVEKQIEQVKLLCGPLVGLPRHPPLRITVDELSSSQGRMEFLAHAPDLPQVPEDVNFLLGDIVTNARSCLDMSVDSIWKYYKLDRKGVVVQFPLEDNYQAKLGRDVRFRKFIERLDRKFVRVIEQSQPNYSGGSWDIPRNLTALFISHLSNANKHRNITPVIMHFSSSIVGTQTNMGLTLHKLGDRLQPGAPIRFILTYDPARNSESDIRRYLTAAAERPRSSPLIIGITQKLIIDRQSIPLSTIDFPERDFNIPAGFDELLNNVPQYIGLTLRNLSRVHDAIQAGDDDVFLDFNAGL